MRRVIWPLEHVRLFGAVVPIAGLEHRDLAPAIARTWAATPPPAPEPTTTTSYIFGLVLTCMRLSFYRIVCAVGRGVVPGGIADCEGTGNGGEHRLRSSAAGPPGPAGRARALGAGQGIGAGIRPNPAMSLRVVNRRTIAKSLIDRVLGG